MPYPHGDGVTEDQQNDLDHLPPGDGEEKWYNMWRVLFPGVPEPTSPYIDIEHYEDYAVDAVYQARGPVFTGGLIELQSNQTLNGDQGEQVMNRFSQAFETSWTNPNVNPVNPVDAPQMIQQQQQQQQQQHYSHAESSSQAAARAPAQNLGPGIQPQCQSHAGGSHSQGLFPSAQLFMPTWTQPEDLRQPNQQPASYTADVNSQWNQDVSSHPQPGHHHRQNGNGAHHSSQSQHPQWRPANNMRRTQPIRSTPHVNHRFNPYGVPHPAQPSCPSSPPPEGFDAAFFNSEFFQRMMSELMAQSQHDTHPDQTSADCFSGIHHQPIPPAAAATHDMLQQHGVVHQPQTMVSDQVLHDIDPDLLGHNFSVPAQNTQPAENAGINSAPQASSSQVGPDPATADEQEEDADASPDDPTDLSDVGSDYFNVRGAP
ncbi:hypothetical protein CkaCkLH20_09506 [Colletotrichum karsti]|uniref:Uncharacterized protein n=1 Tax=Colletotrichum karsti TaxID=1095194 RepID=A0A9P6I181_9PEZI|nr:uncharacterized protein CkaCkLH20_09506 [Colletotrichum karsti]KAF9872996.1 hypothetical protein CkaCkLH20_09506 [Colletotrichum karsti]